MSQRQIHNHKSEILVDKTESEEGYHPDKYGPQSAKFIWCSCRYCGEAHRIRKGFFNKAGSACHKACKIEEQKQQSPFSDPKIREKAKATMLERHGVEFPSLNKDIAKKISQVRKSQVGQDRMKKTNLDRHGVENVFQAENIKEKIRQTNLERYGFESAIQSSVVKEKSIKTNLDRYGVENPQQNVVIKNKTQNTFNKTIRLDENGKYKHINILRGYKIWEMMKQKLSLSDIAKELDLKYQTLASLLSKDEFKSKFQELYTFPTQQIQGEILQFIQSLGFVDILFNDRTAISPLELDIYLPAQKFAIELNGSYWHSEAVLDPKDAKHKHRKKTDLCREQGIRLFHVFEHQWINRKDQMCNFIKTILGCNDVKIGARKCTLTNDECKEFFNDNHIQGYGRRTKKYFNLVYDNEIVASMTASAHHRQNGTESAIVLNRLCFKDGYSVQGGANKLFKALKSWAKDEGYESILSWSDNCWTEGHIYRVLGFELEREYGPDYFYWDRKDQVYKSKQSQRKGVTGCPVEITERDWCFDHGLYRIYDAGKRKWTYNL